MQGSCDVCVMGWMDDGMDGLWDPWIMGCMDHGGMHDGRFLLRLPTFYLMGAGALWITLGHFGSRCLHLSAQPNCAPS